jgi:hypothetical protein
MERIGVNFVSMKLRKPRGSCKKAFETGVQTVALGRGCESPRDLLD